MSDPWACDCDDPYCRRDAARAWDLVVSAFVAEAAPTRRTETVVVTGGVL